jgi:hypothetical protein
MWTAEVVLVCALNLLGRSVNTFPPIEFTQTAPVGASRWVEAYVGPIDRKIYILTTTDSFQRLQQTRNRCGDIMAARKIASLLIHEELHIRQRASEQTAYQAQLMTLTALGASLGSPPYMEVTRAMKQTLKRQQQAPAGLMATSRMP